MLEEDVVDVVNVSLSLKDQYNGSLIRCFLGTFNQFSGYLGISIN